MTTIQVNNLPSVRGSNPHSGQVIASVDISDLHFLHSAVFDIFQTDQQVSKSSRVTYNLPSLCLPAPHDAPKDPPVSLSIYDKTAPTYGMSTVDSATEPTPVERARDELQDSVPKAARTLRDLLDADDERVQIRAAEAILDRAGLTKAKAYGTKQAQVQIGGGKRTGVGVPRTAPRENPEDTDELF